VEPISRYRKRIPGSKTRARSRRSVPFCRRADEAAAFAEAVSRSLLQPDAPLGTKAVRVGFARISCARRDRSLSGRELRHSPEPHDVPGGLEAAGGETFSRGALRDAGARARLG